METCLAEGEEGQILRQGVRICTLLAFEGACIALELEVKLGTEKDSPSVEYWRRSCWVSLSAWNA